MESVDRGRPLTEREAFAKVVKDLIRESEQRTNQRIDSVMEALANLSKSQISSSASAPDLNEVVKAIDRLTTVLSSSQKAPTKRKRKSRGSGGSKM